MNKPEQKLNEKQQRAVDMQAENQAMIQKLAAHGAQVGNLMTTRHEQFIGFLVNNGVITRDQLDDFNIEWEEFVNKELNESMGKVMAHIRQQQIMQGMGPNGGGQQPGPGGLIIPGR